jgi:hypothetical protein
MDALGIEGLLRSATLAPRVKGPIVPRRADSLPGDPGGARTHWLKSVLVGVVVVDGALREAGQRRDVLHGRARMNGG